MLEGIIKYMQEHSEKMLLGNSKRSDSLNSLAFWPTLLKFFNNTLISDEGGQESLELFLAPLRDKPKGLKTKKTLMCDWNGCVTTPEFAPTWPV